MQHSGHIQKMRTSLDGGDAVYQLPIGDDLVLMNGLVGRRITLDFNGEICCANCGMRTRKSYSQGFCFVCCQSLARCDLCIMKPETCHHHLGTCREPAWGLDNCFAPHIVYLANSSGIKVGISRKTNIPSRWIDQGAVEALALLEVDTRLKSGQIEMALKEYVSDKTNWRKMLKNEVEYADLPTVAPELLGKISGLIDKLGGKMLDNEVLSINYPVVEYPRKISSLSFDKTPQISGVLQGIKGQYLLLDTGVLNIRKFGSYHLGLTY
ncbi:MAG: DUF2797 domain-containing protein [Candidatus Thioglobus sp.]|nr:MAG: DUF2797 domain-containing protein [Candidatus Thioglobus sp.]KAA0452469.1 MAG: DUF2797 domain-containing protein [Candidatus Thioglobus sp.]